MTTIQSLSAVQIQNRLVKGLEIYNNGLVALSENQKNLYIVKGKYEVEDLTMEGDIEPFFKCSCPDHSFRGVQCAHIKAVEFFLVNQGVNQ